MISSEIGFDSYEEAQYDGYGHEESKPAAHADSRERILAWMKSIDRSNLTSIVSAAHGWGERMSTDHLQACYDSREQDDY